MHVRVLGAVEVVDRNGGVVALAGSGQRRIVAALAVHAPAAISIERLADLSGVSTGAIRTAMSRIRRLIGEETPATVAGGYALRGASVDAVEFEDALAAARALEGRAAADRFDEALRLWRGSALTEFAAEEWARPSAVRLEELRAGAVEDRAECLLLIGEAIQAAAEMTTHVAEFPLRDRGRALLMRALAAQGRQTEALREFQSYRRFLLDEVGTEPSAELRALDRQIAAGSRHRAPAPDAGRPASNVPRSASSFVGRERELAQIAARLADHSLVTIFGTGGVGKTRLATEVAGRATWAVDGTWMVELGKLRDGSGITDAVALTLGIQGRPDLVTAHSVAEWCAANRALVVLDNCEHVLDDVAALARAVLDAGPKSRLLATSREPLMIDGEHVLALGPLSLVPDVERDSDAVRLFVSRALDEAPQFDAQADPQSVTEICARLDGIPLAIELAAARMRSLSPRDVLDRLDERFRLLVGGHRTAAERHKTLRATVDWSYQLLDEQQRACLDRLSVFAGTFGLDDAVAVADPTRDEWAVLEAVSALVDRSLVVRVTDRRYRLLETLRSYGEQRCVSAGISDDLRCIHSHWFRDKSSDALDRALGPDEVDTADVVVEQLPDYDIAITSALEQGDIACAVDIAENLFECLLSSRVGHMTGMTSISRLLAVFDWGDPNLGWRTQLSAKTIVRALNFESAWSYAIKSDYEMARRCAARTLQVDPTNAYAHAILSHTALIAGRSEEAVEPARIAFAHAVSRAHQLVASLYLGYALDAAGQSDEAQDVARTLRETGDQIGSRVLAAWSYYLLGQFQAHHEPERALESFEVGAHLAEQTRAPVALNFINRQRTKLLLETSLTQARDSLRDALARARRTGDRGNLPIFLAYAVTVFHRLGDDASAARISGHVELLAVPHDEARQFGQTIDELRLALGPQLDQFRAESAPLGVNEVLDLGIAALTRTQQSHPTDDDLTRGMRGS